MSSSSLHFDESGAARMVAVDTKPETVRSATASASVRMKAETFASIASGELAKGDVLQVARLAGINGSKLTSQLIPLCHPVRLTGVRIEFEKLPPNRIVIRAHTTAFDRTGVEMEALTSATTAALTIYDMCKSVDREMEIETVRLESKTGGRSGDYRRES